MRQLARAWKGENIQVPVVGATCPGVIGLTVYVSTTKGKVQYGGQKYTAIGVTCIQLPAIG